ncbi:MAG TPA: hypothetical protein VJ010_09195 [Actinomycetota bacterium]|nr:hypothetical protein [Actinomycetota bacterium]
MTSVGAMSHLQAPGAPPSPETPTLLEQFKEVAARYGERAITEVPSTLRKLRLLFVVASVALPTFLLGVLVILAMALHVHF